MKQINTSLKTLAMKARVYNQIRTALYKKRLEDISQKEKIELFDKIFEQNRITHWELNDYKNKRERKAKRDKLRQERGYIAKKKTSKKEYEERFGSLK